MYENANSHVEITANRCYSGQLPMFKSKLLSGTPKITPYKVLLGPIAVLYACETWATAKTDENKFGVFER